MTESFAGVLFGKGYVFCALLQGIFCAVGFGMAFLKLCRFRRTLFVAFVAGFDLNALFFLLYLSVFPGTVGTGLLVESVLAAGGMLYAFRPEFRFRADWKTLSVPAAVLLFYASFSFVYPQSWDECVYQLAVPVRWIREGGIPVFRDLPYSGFPSLPQLGYLPLLKLGGTQAVKLFYGVCQCALFLGIKPLFRGMPKGGIALFLLSLLLAPVIAAGFRDVYAELFLSLNLAAGLLVFREEEGSRSAGVAEGFFAGAMAAVKLTGFLPAFCLLIHALMRRKERTRYFLMFCLAGGLFCVWFYLRPYMETGNPCYPYLCGMFHAGNAEMSEFHHALGWNKFGYSNPVTGFVMSFGALANRATVFDGEFGFAFLLWLLLLAGDWLFPAKRKRFAWKCLPLCLYYVVWYTMFPQARFLIPGLLLAIEPAKHALRHLPAGKRRMIFYGLVCVCLLLSAPWKIFRSACLDWRQMITGTERTQLDLLYGRTGDDYLPSCAILHALPREGVLLLLFEERTLYMPESARIGTPYFQESYGWNPTPEGMLAEIRAKGVAQVYLRLPVNNPDLSEDTLKRYPAARSALLTLAERGECGVRRLGREVWLFDFQTRRSRER